MGNIPSKLVENLYFRYRKKASIHNKTLVSRERTAELLDISASSLSDYESGKTKVVPADKVALMAELYNAPELRNWYCSKQCPLGKYSIEIADMPAERVMLRLQNVIGDVDGLLGELSKIMDDGVIDTKELQLIPKIKQQLLNIKQRFDENIVMLEKAEKLKGFKG